MLASLRRRGCLRRRHAVVDGLGREALGEGASLQAGVIADVFGGGGEGFEQQRQLQVGRHEGEEGLVALMQERQLRQGAHRIAR